MYRAVSKMNVEKECVVYFQYEALPITSEGAPLEGVSGEGQMLAIVIGAGNVLPELEQALLGRKAGEAFEVDIANAYGDLLPNMRQRVPKKYVMRKHVQPGQTTLLNTPNGPQPVTVLKVGLSVVDVDMNHPLAGKNVRFKVEIFEVRPATSEELRHGHAHGPGGHAH